MLARDQGRPPVGGLRTLGECKVSQRFCEAIKSAITEPDKGNRLSLLASALIEAEERGELDHLTWAQFEIMVEPVDPEVVAMFREYCESNPNMSFDSRHIQQCMHLLEAILAPGEEQDSP